MRLIDLDKIDVFHQEDEDVVFDIIHAIPVDAIPVDWIVEQIKKHGDYEESWNLRGLIDDWRKENEID